CLKGHELENLSFHTIKLFLLGFLPVQQSTQTPSVIHKVLYFETRIFIYRLTTCWSPLLIRIWHSLLKFLRVPYTYHSEGPPLELKRVFPFKEWWVIPFEYLPISVVKNRQILLYKGYGYIHAGYLFKGGIIGLYYQQFLK